MKTYILWWLWISCYFIILTSSLVRRNTATIQLHKYINFDAIWGWKISSHQLAMWVFLFAFLSLRVNLWHMRWASHFLTAHMGKPDSTESLGKKERPVHLYNPSRCFQHHRQKIWMWQWYLPRGAETRHLHSSAIVHFSLSTPLPSQAVSHAHGTREGPSNPPVLNVTVAITDRLADSWVWKEHYSTNSQVFYHVWMVLSSPDITVDCSALRTWWTL